jgi:ribosomal protein L37AE/L43A
MHPTLQCPVCGSTDVIRDELPSGERSWRCRACGHAWSHAEVRAALDVPPRT